MQVNQKKNVKLKEVWWAWYPLALSWLLMGAEMPILIAAIARMAEPEINMAAFGVVLPIAILIESPIIMLLAASTTLCKDWASFQKMSGFVCWAGLGLTIVHLCVACTPLYFVIVHDWTRAPVEVVEQARLGLIIMTPWTWSIAYRRFIQGVLIRFEYSKAIGYGTVVRLLANVAVLIAGYHLGCFSGIIVATTAISLGVLAEAAFVWWLSRPVLKRLKTLPTNSPTLSTASFLRFYFPLALTSFIVLLVQPLATAAISRLPNSLMNLALWPAINGLVFLLKAVGLSYNEVVVALIERKQGYVVLRQFTEIIALGILLVMLLIAGTPLADLWFRRISCLPAGLSEHAQKAFWLAILIPSLAACSSWYQGILLNGRLTRAVTEAVVVFMIVCSTFLGFAVAWGKISGLHAGLIAMTLGHTAQVFWQWLRSRALIT
jgi:hypothetical protein